MLSIEDNFATKKNLYLFNIMVHKIILFIHFYSRIQSYLQPTRPWSYVVFIRPPARIVHGLKYKFVTGGGKGKVTL